MKIKDRIRREFGPEGMVNDGSPVEGFAESGAPVMQARGLAEDTGGRPSEASLSVPLDTEAVSGVSVPSVSEASALGSSGVEDLERKPAIGAEEVAKAMQLLNKYKSGKTNLEARIIEDQEWYRMRHWRQLRRDEDKAKDMPASAWLFNSIANKHADAMDNYPEANVLPREMGDKKAAKDLSAILPVIFEQNHYEKTYSELWDDKLQSGTGVTGVFWDPDASDGIGDIAIRQVDVLSLYWEPGIKDIQESPHMFFVSLVGNEQLAEQYPELEGRLGGSGSAGFTQARYHYDDNVDTSDKSEVIEWYYKKRVGGRTVLHYCKFVSGVVLYATENEGMEGLYAHGQYPFVFDPLFPIKGTPCGFGYVDVMRDCQTIIDSLDNAITVNAAVGAKRRFFAMANSRINVEDYADWTKEFVVVQGSGDPRESIMPIEQPVLPPSYINVLQNKIAELKETSGNRDFSQGGTTAGVTAASAIAALQEAGSKLSRDMITQFYKSYERVCCLVIELIRQFYDVKRSFRILGEGGHQEFIDFDNRGIKPMAQGDLFGTDMGERKPIFDVKVKAQRQSPFSRMSQNELAMELFGKGFFNPQVADQAAVAVGMMEFEGKDEILSRIEQNGLMAQQIEQMKQQMLMLGQMAEVARPGSGIVASLMQQFGMESGGAAPSSGGGGSRMTVNSLGASVAGGERLDKARAAARASASKR